MTKIMKRSIGALFFAGLFCILATNITLAQLREGATLDKIVAVVGEEIIMKSDVDSYLLAMAQNDKTIDINDKATWDKVLNMLIDEKLIVMKAIEDTNIVVSDEEIQQRMDFQIEQYIYQLGSKERLESVFKMSEQEIRYKFRDDIRKRLLAERMQQSKLGGVAVSPREIEEFYAEYADSLEDIPAQVELNHIVKKIKPQAELKAEILQLAKRVRDSLLAGADFADFAKRYSGDLMSAQKTGGDLGWVKKGRFYAEYEKAAYALQKGQISMPVETPFGYHIIQTIDKKEDEIHTRHILFKIEYSDEDLQGALDFLKDIKKRVEEGEKFEDLALRYSDETETKGFGGALRRQSGTKILLPLSTMGLYPYPLTPPNLNEIVEGLKVGGVSEPLIYEENPNLSYRIIYKKSYFPKHKPNMENDMDLLEQMALKVKKQKLKDEWLKELRSEMFWEIKK